MDKSKIFFASALILMAVSVFLGVKYFAVAGELRRTQTALETQKTNAKILEFTKLFVDKVLKADAAVDFETRLKLENAVRDLGDKGLLDQWSRFVASKTEADAQEQVKNLLEMLINKVRA